MSENPVAIAQHILTDIQSIIDNASALTEEKLASIDQRLGAVVDLAGSNPAIIDEVQALWDHALALANVTHDAITANRALVVEAQEITEQRNKIAEELETLQSDITDVNLDNPLVKHIHNEGIDDAFVNYEGFHYDCPGCAAYENGHLPEIDHDAVNIIIAAMMGSFGELSEKRTRQLTRLVNTFGDLMYADNHKDSPFAPDDDDLEDGDDDE